MFLLLHCNVKNTFAEHSDHSLNLTGEMVDALMMAGWTLIVGHEHQGYELRSGRIKVVGNQFPSSVSDCLFEDSKRAVILRDGKVGYMPTWGPVGSFAQIDWQDLADVPEDVTWQFIRVEGDATAAQAADAVSAIAKFRQKSKAFVVTNAVKVEGHQMIDDIAIDTVESIKAFDVMSALMKHLDEREQGVVRSLLS
jgi:hypothetical protein